MTTRLLSVPIYTPGLTSAALQRIAIFSAVAAAKKHHKIRHLRRAEEAVPRFCLQLTIFNAHEANERAADGGLRNGLRPRAWFGGSVIITKRRFDSFLDGADL